MKKIIEMIKFYVSDDDWVAQIGYALTIPFIVVLVPVCIIIYWIVCIIDEIEMNERFYIPYILWDGKREYVCWTRKEMEDTKRIIKETFNEEYIKAMDMLREFSDEQFEVYEHIFMLQGTVYFDQIYAIYSRSS
jgi:hypothetical protein